MRPDVPLEGKSSTSASSINILEARFYIRQQQHYINDFKLILHNNIIMSQYYTIKYIKTKLFKRIYFTTGEVVLKYRILKNHTITDIPEESFF